MKQVNKKIVAFLIGVTVVFALGVGFIKYMEFQTATELSSIQEIDLQSINDGKYIGQATIGVVSAELEVQVKDHKMQSITILNHFYGKGQPAEEIVHTVLSEQKIKVDTVSGATTSSVVILKSIEDALNENR